MPHTSVYMNTSLIALEENSEMYRITGLCSEFMFDFIRSQKIMGPEIWLSS